MSDEKQKPETDFTRKQTPSDKRDDIADLSADADARTKDEQVKGGRQSFDGDRGARM